MKPSVITLIAAIAVVGTGGFFAGRLSVSPTDEPVAETPAGTGSGGARGAVAADGMPSSTAGPRRGRNVADAFRSSEDRYVRLEEIVRGEDPLQRNRALLNWIDQLDADEFEDAVAQFRELGITERRYGEYALLLSAWAKVDPMAALDYATANTRGGFATHTILSTWASEDAEGAIQWAEANHDGDDANPYMAGVIRGIAGSDPNRATQLLSAMPRSRERGRALESMLPHLLTQGPDSVKSWIGALDDEPLRDGAILRAAEPLAAVDPEGTVSWLRANPGEGSRRRMDDVFEVWASDDESAATSALAALPAGDDRSNALRGVVSATAGEDPQRALELMNQYSDDVNDRVLQNFVWHSFGNDPAAAVDQISRISDTRQRDRTYVRILDRWLERDEDAAFSWVEANQVPDQVIEHLNRRRGR